MSATLAVKVSTDFARRYRRFCQAKCLQVGRFTEQALLEMMEDHHFGQKAQRTLSQAGGKVIEHKAYFRRRSRRR